MEAPWLKTDTLLCEWDLPKANVEEKWMSSKATKGMVCYKPLPIPPKQCNLVDLFNQHSARERNKTHFCPKRARIKDRCTLGIKLIKKGFNLRNLGYF